MKIYNVLLFLIFFGISISAQYNDKKFGVGVNAVYTTSAKIYLTPYSSDPVLRNSAFPLSDILNPSAEFKYRISGSVIAGLSIDYMTAYESDSRITVIEGNSTTTVSVEDGFRFIPLELSFYYILPFSTDNFKFLMGGGAGYYFGEHLRKFGDARVSNVERKPAFGINVSAVMDYRLYQNSFLHFEMKFRDPQFNVKSRYESRIINYEGRTVTLSQDEFDSRINIDGVAFVLGVFYQF